MNKLLSTKEGNYMHPKEFCLYWCHGFDKRYTNDGKMETHIAKCFTDGGTKVKRPDIGDNTIVFDQYYQQQVAPYCIYADFESVLKKDSKKKTIHELSGYSKSPYEETKIYHHRGDDAGEVFLKKLESLGKELYKKIKNANAEMIYGEKEKEEFEKTAK